jgi:hypothetical protein
MSECSTPPRDSAAGANTLSIGNTVYSTVPGPTPADGVLDVFVAESFSAPKFSTAPLLPLNDLIYASVPCGWVQSRESDSSKSEQVKQ